MVFLLRLDHIKNNASAMITITIAVIIPSRLVNTNVPAVGGEVLVEVGVGVGELVGVVVGEAVGA